MNIDDVPSVFDRKHTFHCYHIPDKNLMQQAALLQVGKHDFYNFSSAKKSKNTTVLRIRPLRLTGKASRQLIPVTQRM